MPRSPASNNTVLERVEKLSENMAKLYADLLLVKRDVNTISEVKEDVKHLNEIVLNQNQVIVQLLSEVKAIVKTNLTPGSNSSKYSDQFPICNQAELDDIESEISADTMEAMIATVKKILGKGGIVKNITAIFDMYFLLEYNVDGRQQKKRLLDYPKLLKVLYKSADSLEKTNKKDFMKELRRAIRLTKNKHYKIVSIHKNNDRRDNSFFEDGELIN